jgi:hypothetical protein
MQMVINIPEGLKLDFENERWTALSCMEMKDAIAKGTVLPRGHGELVDYEELKNNAREYGAYAETIFSHIKSKTIIEADRSEKEK